MPAANICLAPHEFISDCYTVQRQVLAVDKFSHQLLVSCRKNFSALITCIKWNDFVTNADVNEQSRLDDIRKIINCRRMGLFGHIALFNQRYTCDICFLSVLCCK